MMHGTEQTLDEMTTGRGQPPEHHDVTTAGEYKLAKHLGELARSLHQETPELILHSVVAAAVELIPGTEDASLSIVTRRKEIESLAPSSDTPRRLDASQEELNEGPCLSAVYKERTVRVPDMATEARWPRFARRAAEAGVSSMLAFADELVNSGELNTVNPPGQVYWRGTIETCHDWPASHPIRRFAMASQRCEVCAIRLRPCWNCCLQA